MLEQSLIPADQNWLILASLFAIAAFGLWAEKTAWGGKLSGTVIIILGAMLLSNLSIIPSNAPLYDNLVWAFFVPLAIPLLLFKADLRKIIKETGPTLLAFIIGGIGTIIGTIVAFQFIPLGEQGWKLASIFCATYIGGSINYMSAAEAVGLKNPDLIAAGVAADMLVMAIFFLILLALPSIAFFRKKYPVRPGVQADAKPVTTSTQAEESISLVSMVNALAVATAFCAGGYGIAILLGVKSLGILFVTAFTVLLATFFPKHIGGIKGADQIGNLLILIFFAVIGAGANVSIVMKKSPILFVFAAVILVIHLGMLLLVGWLFKLDLSEIVVASNANLGGPTTAAAMAGAKKWDGLVLPAILVGTLGYAVATFIAVAVGMWLK